MEINESRIQLMREDPRAFGFAYEKYATEIYRYCYYLSSDQHQAEDLTSMTFMKAIERFETFKGDGSTLRAWLYQIARNLFIDEMRKSKNKKEVQIDLGFDKSDENEEQLIENKLLVAEVMDRINKLVPPEYAEVLMLRYKQELEISEIAEILNKKEQNVRTLISRAMDKLRKSLAEGK